MKPLSERDRAVLAQHAAGATLKEIAAAKDMKYATVRRIVECVGPRHIRGQEMLTKDPESLEGLRVTGEISQRAYSAIANATYKIDVPDMERLSDVAAQGRECVRYFPGIGPRVLTELDTILSRFGIQWNPRPRPFAWRTDKNKHPLIKSWDEDRERYKEDAKRSEHWSDIVRRVAQLERVAGSSVMEGIQGRDSLQGVAIRLAYLSGYLESALEAKRGNNMRDITPDGEDDSGYETAGNLICLPGVSLSKVLDGARSDRP